MGEEGRLHAFFFVCIISEKENREQYQAQIRMSLKTIGVNFLKHNGRQTSSCPTIPRGSDFVLGDFRLLDNRDS